MRPRAVLPLAVPVVLAVLATGCDTGTEAPVPERLEIEAPTEEIEEGQDLRLTVTARAGGEEWRPEVEWTSGNPNTVLVNEAGVAHALRTGAAWVHAAAGGVRDSIRLVVRFRQLYTGEMGYRLGGSHPDIRIMGGIGAFFDHLVGDGDVTQVQGQQFQGPELTIWSPGLLTPGSYELASVDPNVVYDLATEPDHAALGNVAILIAPRDGELMGYVTRSGTLKVDDFEVPGEPGRRTGTGRGYLVGTADEYEISGYFSGRPTFEATGATEELMIEFRVRTLHWPVGSVVSTVSGGPATGDVSFVLGFATRATDRIHLAHDGRLDAGSAMLTMDAFIGDVAPGTSQVDSVGPEVFQGHPPDSVTWAGLILDWLVTGERVHGFSRAGSITVESLTLPTDPDLFGVMTGSQTIEFVLREPGTHAPTGETATLTSTFTVPVQRTSSGGAIFTPALCMTGRRCRAN